MIQDVSQGRPESLPEAPHQAGEAWAADAPAPICPKCGARMVLRTAARGPNAGGQFYGCANYPKCREVIAVG